MQMKALKVHRYAGRRLNAGEQFQANARDARVLASVGLAQVTTVRSEQACSLVPTEIAPIVHVAAPIELGAMDADAMPDDPLIEIDDTAPRPRRKYTRRDLTAE